ncbi:DNA mismatch repair protein MutS domain protein [Fibrisoma limi BUZ 3]|uniref:DNA mismatch repair protein MutS domain protein n=2 Tax=Fibrisoma limi TaxID=663275 RepID=I2GRQ6_9BACT|nr:DNA mismatch repair protein MutS domain protein [Fibrisoma limi BUZ 3]
MFMLKRHQTIRRERDLNHHLALINEDEAARLKRQYLRPETGEEFADPTHYYSGDLDVFGKHSLYRLLNRTHTYEGKQRLAKWLKAPASPDAIRLRQQAVGALTSQLDWRQQFEALAYLDDTIGNSPESLRQWATAEAAPLPAYLNIVRFLLPAVTTGLIIAWMVGYLPGLAVLIALAVHGLVLSQTSKLAQGVSEQTFDITKALNTFRSLFEHAEQQKSEATRIRAIKQALLSNGIPASKTIGRLSSLTEGLNYRRNPYFYVFVAVLTLWDVHYLHRLERWRQQHGPDLSRWFEALGELETLNSLAGFAFAHPGYAIPDIAESELTLEATAAAHPLLSPDKSVPNSLSLTGSGQTVLITGSNMSGKSTFLRTLGANAVLALMGAVVSAEKFICSPVQVFTSMRTHDSLEESTSSFYAELKRLQTLIGLAQPQPQTGLTERLTGATEAAVNRSDGTSDQMKPLPIPVLYFLDEILKGTNSADRHRGAEALIRQLHRTSASGFVSTHDLELGQLSDASNFVRNYHFQSDLRNGELLFDYKLRQGICESFNASQLMRAIGIQMDAVQPQ